LPSNRACNTLPGVSEKDDLGLQGSPVFTTTQWGMVLDSAQTDAGRAQASLAELCQLYWPPIYAFIRRRGYAIHDAQDLTQDFFAHFLGSHALRSVDRSKGKFRSFLLASLKHFLSDAFDRSRAQKRGGGYQFVSFDDPSVEHGYLAVTADDLTPEKIFEARWAATLIDEALLHLREQMAAEGKERIFDVLREYLTVDRATTYEATAAALGVPLGTVKTMISRLRKRYAGLLRQEIARTVADPREIDGEIEHLCAAL
jgi:RNA polymerase sigma factor (sigma-70 family)